MQFTFSLYVIQNLVSHLVLNPFQQQVTKDEETLHTLWCSTWWWWDGDEMRRTMIAELNFFLIALLRILYWNTHTLLHPLTCACFNRYRNYCTRDDTSSPSFITMHRNPLFILPLFVFVQFCSTQSWQFHSNFFFCCRYSSPVTHLHILFARLSMAVSCSSMNSATRGPYYMDTGGYPSAPHYIMQ